jgi:DNA-binding NarL/FixJ family response regulator
MNRLSKITFAIADDHVMLRKGLVKMLVMLGNYEPIFDVDNGDEVIEALKKHKIPDVLILDVNMAGKGGLETAAWVTNNYPQIKILALSMYNDESTIIKMIQAGAKGYLTKNNSTEKLEEAINTLYERGIYIPESISLKLFSGIRNNVLATENKEVMLNDKEKTFLSLICQEYSYQEIADKMILSPRTIDDYRRKLCLKLKVRGKSGLIVYALNNGLCKR